MSSSSATARSSAWDNTRPSGTTALPGDRWFELPFTSPGQFVGRRPLTSSDMGRHLLADQTERVDANDIVDEPVEVSRIPERQPRFLVLQKWEGRVTDCFDDGFRGLLSDITTPGIEERAEFDLDEVSRDDLALVIPGAVFYWSVGYREEGSGERSRSSLIKFRRLPGWSPQDVQRVHDRVDDLKKRMSLVK